MKAFTLIATLSLILLSVSSCQKNDGLTPVERRAVGEYKFEKVVIHDDWFDNKNITQEYNNMILQLDDKKEAAIIDQNNNITYYGKYDVIEQRGTNVTDDDGNTSTNVNYTIIIDIKTNGRGNGFHWVGQNASFGNKMRFTVKYPNERYKFKLDKI